MKNGFTLVELLIVIALIAILSVAVLATINPIEQANKARDASVQNDAAEVLNAYERYYTNTQHYPWMDVNSTGTATVDAAYFGRSTQVGFGLCGNSLISNDRTACESQSTPGMLISTQELKDSFLSKSYTKLPTNTGYSYQDQLYVVKLPSDQGNSIYVCYVPKAKSNRVPVTNSTWSLYQLSFVNGTVAGEDGAIPSGKAAVLGAGTSATYTALLTNGGNDTLFRCVP